MLKPCAINGNMFAFAADEHMDYDKLLQEAVYALVDYMIDDLKQSKNEIIKLAEPLAEKFIRRAYVVYPGETIDSPFVKEDLNLLALRISGYAALHGELSDLSDPAVKRLYEEYKKQMSA